MQPVVDVPECISVGKAPYGFAYAILNPGGFWGSKLQEEFTYIALFFLLAVFLLMSLWRIVRAAGTTIGQLRYEADRDRKQHQRIADEKRRQYTAMRQGTRRINGKPRSKGVRWDQGGRRRAQRDFHIDESADEVFNDVSDDRGMDVRTPWGWPSSSGKQFGPALHRPRRSKSSGIRDAISAFFKTKHVIDDEYRAHREQSIRHLLEDRYGRVGSGSQTPDFEYSTPQLPQEYVEERETDQLLASKIPQDPEAVARKIKVFRIVSDLPHSADNHKKVSGE